MTKLFYNAKIINITSEKELAMSTPVAYCLTVIVAVMATVKIFFQNDFMRRYSRNIADMAVYMIVMFSLISLFLSFFLDYSEKPHAATIILAVCWGASTAGCQITYSKALSCGPVSLTVLITTFALIIPIIYGVFGWGNSISVTQWLGLALLAAAFVLLLYKKNSGKQDGTDGSAGNETEEPADKKPISSESKTKKYAVTGTWVLLTLITTLGFGIGNVLSTQQQLMYPAELNWFVFVSYLSAAVTTAVFVPFTGRKATIRPSKRLIADMVLGAAALGIHNYLRPMVSVYLPPAVFQSLASILNIIFITFVGLAVFRDKITKIQWIGVGVSVLSIILLCI